MARRSWLVALAATVSMAAAAEPPVRHLESRRLRARTVYVGTVTTVSRLGALEGLALETQGRMEALVHVVRVWHSPAGVKPPADVAVRFDSRAPDPDDEGFYTLVPGEAVLVFADGFEPAYPRDLFHGAPAALAAEVKALRDFVAAMDADTMRLHGLVAATRARQVRLYDEVLALLARMPA